MTPFDPIALLLVFYGVTLAPLALWLAVMAVMEVIRCICTSSR